LRSAASVTEVFTAVFRLLFLLPPLLGFVLLAGCTPPGPGPGVAGASVSTVSPNEYVIGPGDSLSVFVYQSPDLSEQAVSVRPDGKISIPLVQDIQAAGTTPPQLANQIADRLRQYVREPKVTVIVRSFVGPANRQVRVIGQATEPTAIPYRDGLSMLDVMIAVKGLTKYAAGNRAMIIRHEPSGQQEVIHVHLDDLMNDGDMSQNIRMQPGDTLVIPESFF
jgi:polysaccharide biosynthesis/export protein